jgi:hypothetical protein
VQGGQCQRCACRIAAGVGDERSFFDLISEQFRQAIDGVSQILAVGVRLVVLLIDRHVLNSIIGAEVDDFDAGFEQLGHKGHRDFVRQTAQGDIGDLCQLAQIERSTCMSSRPRSCPNISATWPHSSGRAVR